MWTCCCVLVLTGVVDVLDVQGDEEGDTYEAPPCERPNIKVQRQPVEENVYLGI